MIFVFMGYIGGLGMFNLVEFKGGFVYGFGMFVGDGIC